jgi:hypothetical protein
MKKEFNKLANVLERYDLTEYGDELDMALKNLKDKIDEVEKRMECARRSATEVNDSISKYTQRVDDQESFVMTVDSHDSIQNGSNDVLIALDLNEDMCIEDNWYNLFSTKVEPNISEVFMTFESSWGEITCAKDGVVLSVNSEPHRNFYEKDRGEQNYLFDIIKIDLVEYEKFLNSIDQELDHDSDDILSVGFWNKDNTYSEPDHDWRKNMFSPEDDEDDEDDEAPTMLCQDEDKHNAVKDIIAKLKEIEVDGETMEYILDQVGMLDQVAKQLGLVNF